MHAQKLDMGKERVDLRMKLDWYSEREVSFKFGNGNRERVGGRDIPRRGKEGSSTDAAILIPDRSARRKVGSVWEY